ncbi:MAG: AAA family ATPase, partial [Planctomycetota bacterium]
MLKALELAGFKSFADRTRFDFPDGITVVVGPNGSGKSNIVDAMKWVLGSQSAKALRGKDMADVIFKGSQTRGPSGSAEVTIIFDNPDGVLPVDAPEVHITRRVYRSGESEYLINKEAVRLKDIRNLIRGTGIGIDAYSLIEQGKVDRMLQANAKDRRAIFEEAAGISRFKAKKTEAERRLTRVQSNLTRLGDIVDEVGSRLRSIRAQASKAEKYRQTSHRLKLLRVHSAHFDWSNLSAELADLERERATAAEQMETLESQRSESRELRRVADAKLSGLDEKLRQIQSRQNDNAREVAVLEARLQSNRKTREENKTPLASTLNRVRVLRSQQQLADQAMADELRRHEKYKVELDDILRRADEVHEETSRLESEASQLRLTRDQQAQNHISTVRELSKLKDDRQSRVASLETKSADLRRAESLSEQLNISLQEAHQLSKQTNSSVESLQHRRQDTQRELDKQVAKIAEVERTLSRRREEESALLLKIQTLQERRRVLEELQRRREGISGGVQEVLEALEQGSTESESPPSHSIEEVRQSCRGIVADAIEADVKVAPLIDAALGERSQYLVVRGDALQQAIIQKNIRLEQRVGLIRLDELPPRRPGDRIRLDGLKGVLGRGDRLVKCDPAVEDLVRHLLCNTWLVDSLETAYGLRRLSGAGLRFVTTDGHLLENDGSLVIGSAASAAGLVSRQSELQAAIQEADHYQYQLESASEETKALAERLDDYIATRGQHEQHLREIATNLATAVAEQRHAVERLERCQSEKTHNQQIIHDVQQVLQTIGHQKSALDGQIAETAKTAEQYEAETASLDEQLSEVTTVLEQSTSLRMSLSVDLAKAEQKFEAASDKLSSHHAQQAEREARLTETRLEADAITSRQREAQLEWLIANEKHAKCINRNEVLASEYASHARDASTIRRDNEAILNRDDELIQKTATASK